ncbi:unnamed protein product [Rhizophagus irregularis]|nr:unnamed protein product [Rhizophagus irregularis]
MPSTTYTLCFCLFAIRFCIVITLMFTLYSAFTVSVDWPEVLSFCGEESVVSREGNSLSNPAKVQTFYKSQSKSDIIKVQG